MAEGHRTFDRIRLRPTQLRTVAERRFADAEALRDTGRNERANGVMYLGGFVIECLLKAKLLETFRWLQSAGSAAGRPRDEQHLWSLCYPSHDLEEILARLPAVTRDLERSEQQGRPMLLRRLRQVCASWTIFARYSPYSATMDEAAAFAGHVMELKEWPK